MSILINFPSARRECSADDVIAAKMREMGQDSHAARSLEQSMYVALDNIHSYWCALYPGSRRSLTALNIARLDSHTVAAHVAADLSPEGRAGVEHCVANLIKLSQEFVAQQKTPPTSASEGSGLQREIKKILKLEIARLAPLLPVDYSYAVRATIHINLTIESAPGQSEFAA